MAAGTLFTAAAFPVVIGAVVVFGIGIGLNALDNRYGIKNSVKSGMRYAVDNISFLHEQAIRISAKDLQPYTEKVATSIMQELMDEAHSETKSWMLRKIQPGDLPLPNWPKAPELPSLSNFKLPKV